MLMSNKKTAKQNKRLKDTFLSVIYSYFKNIHTVDKAAELCTMCTPQKVSVTWYS